MTSAEPWAAATAAAGAPQQNILSTAQSPDSLFQPLQTQSVPAESLNSIGPYRNNWLGLRAATEVPEQKKEDWAPNTPPQLVVSIIGQLLKLLPDNSKSNPNTHANEEAASGSFKSDSSIGATSVSPQSFAASSGGAACSTTVSMSNPLDSSPFKPQMQSHAPALFLSQPHFNPFSSAAAGAAATPAGAAASAATVKIAYAECPCVFVVQSADYQPYVQIRRSSQPAIHIYTRSPLTIEDQFDATAQQQQQQQVRVLPPGEHAAAAAAAAAMEYEGLESPYSNPSQPTIFIHHDNSFKEKHQWKPRICIDTTTFWWPSVQCTFLSPNQNNLFRNNPFANYLNDDSSFNVWGRCFKEEHSAGVSVSGPLKPLTIDLPY